MGHEHLSWTPPAGFPQSRSTIPATAPSRKLTGPCSLYFKPPPTAHVKREFLRMASATPGNALNVSSASSCDLESNADEEWSPFCTGPGACSITPRPSAGQARLLTYPSEGRARLGLCVGAPRPLGPWPDWGRPVEETPPHTTRVSRGQQWCAMATWLARDGCPQQPTLGESRGPLLAFPNSDPAGRSPRCLSAQPEATQAGTGTGFPSRKCQLHHPA